MSNISAAALDFYVKGPAFAQTIQDKPLLSGLIAKQKTFSGGAGNISLPVQFDYDTSSFQGFTHNDTVTYSNPANVKRALYPWKEVHAGISLTLTELKIYTRTATRSDAATNPQPGARPAVGIQREMATDGEAAQTRDAEIPRQDVRSEPKAELARPPSTRHTGRKWRLNFLSVRPVCLPASVTVILEALSH